MKWTMIKNTPPINEQLSTQHKRLQQSRRNAFIKQLSALKYLLRQGMAIRGHTKTEGNLHQLLMTWASDDADLKCWLQENKYMSHDLVYEQIKIMSLSILHTLLKKKIKACSPSWYAIIGDEAMAAANREQFNYSLRWVDNNYEVSEDAVDLFSLPNTTADTIFTVIEDILSRCSLPLLFCRWQAFDGAENMQGKRKGVATRIWKENPVAIVVHCYAHCLSILAGC